MSQKIVVITGAGSGLGASLAKLYAADDYFVCLLGRKEEKLLAVGEQLPANKFASFPVDVSSFEEVKHVFKEIETTIGPVDILINNAGVGGFKLLEDLDEAAIHQMIDVNLKGTIFCTQAVLPAMKERNKGTVINVISTAGLEGKKLETVYCASKFGAKGFTESLIVELKETNIRVVGAYMGGMKTPFWSKVMTAEQMAHLMAPEDVAEVLYHNVKQRNRLTVDQVVIRNHSSTL